MKTIKSIVLILFVVTAIAFAVMFCYDRLVLDHVAPQIACDGVKLEVSVAASDAELCRGLRATDDVDGDITDRIIVRRVSRLVGSNSAIVYYAVFDSASNFCTFTRNVYYTDYQQPRFHLSQPMIFNVSSLVTLADRISVYDVIDGDITSRLRVSAATISATAEGDYPMTVQVTNSTGDTATLSLTVSIRNYTSRHPIIHLSEYLTYAEMNSEVNLEDYRDMIISAHETVGGRKVDPKNISISGQVNTSRSGCYDVKFSYTNDSGLNYSVILTVVVE